MTAEDLVSLVPLLVMAYLVVAGGVALTTGWQAFSGRMPPRRRRGTVAPPVDGSGDNGTGAEADTEASAR